jgi:mono/diheme cytochrome c family protein
MGIVFQVFVLALILLKPMAAQTVSAKGLSEEEKPGLKLFLQRCAVCHLGLPPRYQRYGPVLHKELIAARGDEAVRKKIMEGSQLMPGFQYTLKPADVDRIVTYLKVVSKEAVTVAPQGENVPAEPTGKAPEDGH